jgi:predicted MFS family arabinose efflux permease
MRWLDRRAAYLIATNVLGTAYLTLAPALVGAFVDRLHIGVRDAGFITSAQLAGSAIGGVAVLLGPRRGSSGGRLRFALVGMAACDLVCAFLSTARALMIWRLLSGTMAGIGFTTANVVAGNLPQPARVYGAMVVGEMTLGIAGYLAMPMLLASIGVHGIFFALGTLALLSAVLAPRFPPQRVESTAGLGNSHARISGGTAMLFVSLSCVYLANASIWAYLDRIGIAAGLSENAVSVALAISMFVGLAGAIGATRVAMASLARLPIAIAVLVMAGSTALLFASSSVALYSMAVAGFNGTIMFVLPFYLSAFATAPGGERNVTVAGIIIFIGLALGPMIGSELAGAGNYDALIAGASIVFFLGAALGALGRRGNCVGPRNAGAQGT